MIIDDDRKQERKDNPIHGTFVMFDCTLLEKAKFQQE